MRHLPCGWRWYLPGCLALIASLRSPSIAVASGDAIKPPSLEKPLIACWAFDELSGPDCVDASGNEYRASAAAGSAIPERVPGLFGNALSFSGNHLLRVEGKPKFGTLSALSMSAWVAPTELGGFREIFRKEDGEHRVLFSFQEGGSILSLGLNIGGYVECDATIDPAQVLDGIWHHCAATFDGRWMRVYLDGRQVGQLDRPGTIVAGGDAPGCIGSSHGDECFQGTLDDLRIYAQALGSDEISQLYRSGVQAMQLRSKEFERIVQSLYPAAGRFSEALMAVRKGLLEKGVSLDRASTGIIVAKLRTDFPKEYEAFLNYTGTSAAKFLTAQESQFHKEQASRVVELMLEYKPLTEGQWKKQTPEQLAGWKQVDEIQQRLEALRALGSKAEFSPEWIDIILEAGRRIQFRPVKHEPVAPYATPQTPPTRNLSSEEAREALRRDWLHQADQNPTPERIRNEISWTRELAARITVAHPDKVNLAAQLARLDELDRRAAALRAADAELYFQVREVKRAIALANPVIDFNQILLVDMPYPQGSEWRHETRHRLGYMAVPGGRLLVLEGLGPEGKLRQLMPQLPLHGTFWRPDLSFDARKVVVSFKPHNEKAFHLYEINIDGTDLVQLTDGIYDDLDPIYLPDEEHVIFITTRGHNYVRCMPPTNAYMMARCDRNGRNIYLISQSNEPEYLPSILSDGRVIYTRWEYTDKPLWRAQSLWTVNPDGTYASTFWGNQSVWPDLLKDARSIPGSQRVMFTGSAHHDWFSGSVGIVDPAKGLNFPNGLTKVTADVPWPESGNGPVDPVESPRYHRSGDYPAYYSPYPLGEQDFLVSASRGGKFLLYLMDIDGNRELIYEGVHNIFHAQPLKSRLRPPAITDRVQWPSRQDRLKPAGGVIFSGNIYQGAPEELRGKARHLRVLTIEPKTYTYWYKRPYISTGPVVSAVQSEGVKRVIGTVPIETDGSVAFSAPSGVALHFQLLDENYRALQTMRSFTGVMPGERRGCQGCHELHSTTPPLDVKPIALTKPPQAITPPPWGNDTVSYARYVQPVLDKYCGKCHQGDGEGRKALDLSCRPGFLDFCEPYLTLIGRPTWGTPYQAPKVAIPGFGIANVLMVEGYSTTDPKAYQTPKPMHYLSYKSRLVEIASSGKHYDVKVDETSRQRLIAWIDAMCPYLGDEEVRALDDPVFQGVDWLAIRPRIRTAPTIVRPGPVD